MNRCRYTFRCLTVILTAIGLWTTTASAVDITLAWNAPTLNTDGSPLTDLAGYRISYCVGAGCTPTIDIMPDLGLVTTYKHTGLPLRVLHRYKIRAINTIGSLSPDSNIVEESVSEGITIFFQ